MIKYLLTHPPQTADDFGDVLRKILRTTKSYVAIPAKSELLKSYHKLLDARKIKKSVQLEKLLTKRAVRTLSGVAIVTTLTKPFPCPGKCVYCPSEARMPKSYLSDEPAANRALNLKFDPYEQVVQRIKALETNGHPTDKIELIVKGGTWNAYPIDYQYWFIARCFEASNHQLGRPVILNEAKRSEESLSQKNRQRSFAGAQDDNYKTTRLQLLNLQKTNESAPHRIIGLTLETRPDYINEKTIKIMRELGCTRVELGVQTTDDKILKLIKRGHDTEEVKRATKLLKNWGFKVDYHLMPQLPTATPAKDLKMMLEIFDDPDYRPDMIKIYPCTVIQNSELYQWLKRGGYKTYSNRKLIDVLKKFKTKVPRYVRISRLIRDIPSHHIHAGNKTTNLRQVIQKEMAEEGLSCECLRCREVGRVSHLFKDGTKVKSRKIKLFVDKYEASGGTEYFLSYEDAGRNCVYAFCRLRILSLRGEIPRFARDKLRNPPNNKEIAALPTVARDDKPYPAFLRELHTYGQLVGIGKKTKGASQHIGMGVKLVKKAEELAKKAGVDKLAVISGVGVRGYYKKLGYKLENTYMVKNIE